MILCMYSLYYEWQSYPVQHSTHYSFGVLCNQPEGTTRKTNTTTFKDCTAFTLTFPLSSLLQKQTRHWNKQKEGGEIRSILETKCYWFLEISPIKLMHTRVKHWHQGCPRANFYLQFHHHSSDLMEKFVWSHSSFDKMIATAVQSCHVQTFMVIPCPETE